MNLLRVSQSRIYNKLPGIAEVNNILAQIGGDETVGEVLSVIKEAGLEEYLGVRLLHKHNDIADTEIMFESSVVDAEGFALVTSAISANDRPDKQVNSWKMVDGVPVPIEFSDLQLVRNDFSPREHQRTFQRIAQALLDCKADAILGPCLNYSAYVKTFSPAEDAAFLEKTDVENRANVVRYVLRSDVEFANSAKTKWHARQIIDDDGRLSWTTACNCFCSVSPNGNGHQGTTTHRYSAYPASTL